MGAPYIYDIGHLRVNAPIQVPDNVDLTVSFQFLNFSFQIPENGLQHKIATNLFELVFTFAEVSINIKSMIDPLVGGILTNTFSAVYSSLCYDAAPFVTYLPEFRRNLLPSSSGWRSNTSL